MKSLSDQINAKLDAVTEKIRQSEARMKHIWFDFTLGDLAWTNVGMQGRRLCHGNTPLLECRIDLRIEAYKVIDQFVSSAESKALAELNEVTV